MARGKLAAMALACFQSRCFSGRAEDPEPGGPQGVGNPCGQRALGSDEHEIDLFRAAERHNLPWMARVNLAAVRCATVARSNDDAIAEALQGAGHGVFTSARSEHKDSHAKANSKDSLGATPDTSTGYFPVKQAVQ